eukprot:g24067.t1
MEDQIGPLGDTQIDEAPEVASWSRGRCDAGATAAPSDGGYDALHYADTQVVEDLPDPEVSKLDELAEVQGRQPGHTEPEIFDLPQSATEGFVFAISFCRKPTQFPLANIWHCQTSRRADICGPGSWKENMYRGFC